MSKLTSWLQIPDFLARAPSFGTPQVRIGLGVVVFPVGLHWLTRRVGIKSIQWRLIAAGLASFAVLGFLANVLGANFDNSTSSATADSSVGGDSGAGSSSASPAPAEKANIYVVASKSFCSYTGIDDGYTGDGHVEFFLTVRNSGNADGTLGFIPVRHYDDGTYNDSPLDEAEVDVAAGQVWRGHTQAFKYKAHEHEVEACGVKIGSHEVPIKAIGL